MGARSGLPLPGLGIFAAPATMSAPKTFHSRSGVSQLKLTFLCASARGRDVVCCPAIDAVHKQCPSDNLHPCRTPVRLHQRQLSRERRDRRRRRAYQVGRASGRSADSRGREGDRSLESDCSSRPDRLPHPPGRRAPTSTTRSTPSRTRPIREGFNAEKNARTTLLAGFTTVRDVGSGRSWPSICATPSTRDTSSDRAWWPAGR